MEPFAIGYIPSNVIRHVVREHMDERGVLRMIEAVSSLDKKFSANGKRYHLLIDALKKSFTSFDANLLMVKAMREKLTKITIDRTALVSFDWYGAGDSDGIPSFKTISEGWTHLTGEHFFPAGLFLVTGAPGSGKSTIAEFLAKDHGAVLIADETSARATCKKLLEAGRAVVLDLGFQKEQERKFWVELANDCGVESWIYFVEVEPEERWDRVKKKSDESGTPVNRGWFDNISSNFEQPAEGAYNLAVVRW